MFFFFHASKPNGWDLHHDDDTTMQKLRLDVGRVLINTSTPEIIYKVIKVKVNSVIYCIRLMEETYGDIYSRINSNWNFNPAVAASSEEEVSVVDSLFKVVKIVFTLGLRQEELQQINEDFSNSLIRNIADIEDMEGSSHRNVASLGKGGDALFTKKLLCLTTWSSGQREVCLVFIRSFKPSRVTWNLAVDGVHHS